MKGDKPTGWDRANGYMVLLRLVLPVMVTVMMYQLNSMERRLSDVRNDLTGEIKELRTTINSDVRHDLSDVKERLAALEKQAVIDTKRLDDTHAGHRY